MAVVGILLVAGVVVGQTSGRGRYRGAGVSKASNIPYPVNTAVTGMVTLEVSVSPSGQAANVQTVVDVPPLTQAAAGAVKRWQYSPAMLDGQPVPGIVDVNVVFNPFNPGGVGIPSGTAAAPEGLEASRGDFRPALVKSATFAVYPENTVTSGTAVVMVKVGSDGSSERVDVCSSDIQGNSGRVVFAGGVCVSVGGAGEAVGGEWEERAWRDAVHIEEGSFAPPSMTDCMS